MEVSPVGISTAGTSAQGPLETLASCAVVWGGGVVAQPTASRRKEAAYFMGVFFLGSPTAQGRAKLYIDRTTLQGR